MPASASTQNKNYDQLFTDFFQRYVHDIYRIVLAAVSYDDPLAQRLLYVIFADVYKYFHNLTQLDSSARLYLLERTVHALGKLDTAVPSTHEAITYRLKSKLTPIELKLWQALQVLPRHEWLVYELWYGEKLDHNDVAVVLQQPLSQIQTLQVSASQRLRLAVPGFAEYLPALFDKRNQWITLARTQQAHLLRQFFTKRKRPPTFVAYPWWRRALQPTRLAIGAGTLTLIGLAVVAFYYFPTFWQPAITPAWQQTSAFLDTIEPLNISSIRPRLIKPNNTLPPVTADKLSLTEVAEPLYGTNYVAERTNPNDDAALTPTITMALPEQEYLPVLRANIYAVPEALDEDQLQFASLRHFSSLPLNQFTYVNGTYYIEEDPNTYQPLFIAFNADGTIDFQMRKLAICALPNLTKNITTNAAEAAGFDFLTAHNFVEVGQTELEIQLISTADRTVPKAAFCDDDDQAPVQDREFVYWPPHTVFRYAGGTNDFLPMRLRGLAVQLHGENVTNLRVDKFFLMQQYAVRTHEVELKPLAEATSLVQQFTYPAAADSATYQPTQQVFAQWHHQYGEDRLTDVTLTSVRLEYVFDELNHLIEPYYVFNGEGNDLAGRTLAVRLYVVASTEQVDLRSPYRE